MSAVLRTTIAEIGSAAKHKQTGEMIQKTRRKGSLAGPRRWPAHEAGDRVVKGVQWHIPERILLHVPPLTPSPPAATASCVTIQSS